MVNISNHNGISTKKPNQLRLNLLKKYKYISNWWLCKEVFNQYHHWVIGRN